LRINGEGAVVGQLRSWVDLTTLKFSGNGDLHSQMASANLRRKNGGCLCETDTVAIATGPLILREVVRIVERIVSEP
jgi:hypothetical protein